MSLRRCVWLTAVVAAITAVQVAVDGLETVTERRSSGFVSIHLFHNTEVLLTGYPLVWQERHVQTSLPDFDTGPFRVDSTDHIGRNDAVPVCLILFAGLAPLVVA